MSKMLAGLLHRMAVEIIAEIGVNHQNDLALAHRLIDEAKAAGADAAKFQVSIPELEVSRRAAPEHYALIKSLVPSRECLVECKAHCDQIGIEFLCTPAEEDSLAWLIGLGVKRIKIASDNLTNIPFIRAVNLTGLPIIFSTGMGTPAEINRAMCSILKSDIAILHCTSSYPCPAEDANLAALRDLASSTNIPVGWSDHTTSTALAAVAVGLGAVMIEKHLTLDRNAPGPDHRASLEPWQFKAMVENIREAEAAMGDGIKRLMPSEEDTARVVLKSLVARLPIRAGDVFTAENLTVKRPGTGIPASRWGEVIGKASTRDYQEDELIAW